MKHLISITEVKEFGRQIGNVDDNKLLTFITEVEQMYIKPAIGERLLNQLLENPYNEEYKILLEGGSYTDTHGDVHSLSGLKVTISYYVYAQNLMVGDIQSTRFGSVLKQNDYSNGISSKERSDAYNNTLEIANYYLSECVSYCLIKKLSQSRQKIIATGGCTIRKIGK